MDKVYSAGPVGNALGDPWPNSVSADMPKIVSLDVKCEKNSMKVFLSFDKPFYGIVFSKGHYSNGNCVHLPAGLGRTSVNFEISIHACGTSGNTENGLYGYGADSGSGTYFENIIVIQYDPQVQEVWDQARKLRCTWHDQYEKSVTFRPFPVDMLDVVRADFAGDNVGCWMQIQVNFFLFHVMYTYNTTILHIIYVLLYLLHSNIASSTVEKYGIYLITSDK